MADKPERVVTPGPDPECPPDPLEGHEPTLRMGTARFLQASVAVAVELAEELPIIMRGLMYRKKMPADRGMLFLLDEVKDQSFWMKNTCIPLDMLYIADDGLIVGIEENVPTLTLETRSCGCPSHYVLEMNAGWARKHNVRPGQFVRFDGI